MIWCCINKAELSQITPLSNRGLISAHTNELIYFKVMFLHFEGQHVAVCTEICSNREPFLGCVYCAMNLSV